jgi:hypothetical protein
MATTVAINEASAPTGSVQISSPIYWCNRNNPNLSFVQVEALPDIDAELVTAYRQKFSKYRIVVADRKDIIHLSNHYTRSSIAEYLRALLPGHVVKRLQEIIDSHPHMTTEEQQIDFAYKLDISAVLEEYGCSIDALLDRESSLEVHRREIELLKRIDLSPGFLGDYATTRYTDGQLLRKPEHHGGDGCTIDHQLQVDSMV